MTQKTDIDKRLALLERARDKGRKKWGLSSVSLGSHRDELEVVPSPSWMLDWKIGTGGFPFGHIVEAFGANSLGKSSALVYPTMANLQAMGRIPALLATEPLFDLDWATRLGVDPNLMLLNRPDNAEEAFEMIHDLVYENDVDYIFVDSLGALASASETKEDSKGKKAFGISGVVTAGLNAVLQRMYKNRIGMLIVNQQRQDAKASQVGVGVMQYESPGGEGLHHNAVLRIHLKPGKNRYTMSLDGEDQVVVGRELICQFKKNKLSPNMKAARFDFYYQQHEKFDNKFGVDRISDILRTARSTGVIRKSGDGSWLTHESFPGPKHQVNGEPGLKKYLEEHPEGVEPIRKDVLAVIEREREEERKRG